MAEPLLAVEDLRVDYFGVGTARAVDGVSFQVAPGESFGLVGESGSGKSTVALALLRLLRPPAVITGGRILWEGADVLDMDEPTLRRLRGRRVALVPQQAQSALSPLHTVEAQLSDAIAAHERVDRASIRARAAALLDLVGLPRTSLARYPHELSAGMRQRVVVAAALAGRPELLVLDEPTSSLDVLIERELLGQIDALRRELRLALLLVGHDLALVASLCARVGVMYAGTLVEILPASDLLERARHPYTRALLACRIDARNPTLRRSGIPGAAPDPARPAAGCPFGPRCPAAFDRCAVRPPLVRVAADHEAACHLHP